MFTMAAVLLAQMLTLLGPVSTWLARAPWVTRAPRSAVALWQAIGLGALVSGIGGGLAVAVYRYHAGFAPGVGKLTEGLIGGHPLQGLGLPDALGLTLAADLLIVLFVVFGCLTVGTIRSRDRHRRLLNLLAWKSSEYPGTDLIEDARPVAYCLPGRRPRIVISEGALRLLTRPQAHAVIEHERGHAHEHHGLVMLPMWGLRKIFAWVPYARLAPLEMGSLLEMAADDYSAKRNDPVELAEALVRMATSGHAPTCALGAAGHSIPKRVDRLLGASRNSKRIAIASAALAGLVVSTPLAVMLL
jgi:Zn-dependent protease with chaperone function